MATELDYYITLGVERTATDTEIKKAFRRLAQQWHPDVNTDPGAQARFKEINEAYQVLSDPQRRQTYDMFGKAGLGGDGGAGFDASGFGSFSDIFDAFFGGAASGGARRGHPAGGSDLRYDIRITFEEAVRGADKEIEFPVYGRCDTCAGTGAKPGTQPVACDNCGGRGEIRTTRRTMLGQMVNVTACPRCQGEGKLVTEPCETCHGEGRTERKRTLRVSIPAGIDEGHQIRLSNEGEVGVRGGTAGSLYVAVHVTPHPQLRREGTELFYEADVSIVQAALGTRCRADRGRRRAGRGQGGDAARHRDWLRGRASPICGGPAPRATSTCSSTSSFPPSCPSASASSSPTMRPRPARR